MYHVVITSGTLSILATVRNGTGHYCQIIQFATGFFIISLQSYLGQIDLIVFFFFQHECLSRCWVTHRRARLGNHHIRARCRWHVGWSGVLATPVVADPLGSSHVASRRTVRKNNTSKRILRSYPITKAIR